MAITTNSDRQYPLVAEVTFDFTQVGNDTPEPAIELPAGARVVNGYVIVNTDWDDDAAETFTLDVGDNGAQAAADPNRFTQAAPLSIDADAGVRQSLDSATANALGYKYTQPTSITVEVNPSVGASNVIAGNVTLVIEYLIEDRSNENQG